MQEVWEKKRKKGKIILIINKKLTEKKKEENINKKYINNTHACPIFFGTIFLIMLGNNFGVWLDYYYFIKNSFM